ncbi:MAG TPA: branched-chain amino acid ABC transporter permease [Stellaceae bacterium]|jgi:branched-chain amino acid transport system permease protein|nr:branched-chain amino acid ABC transporter permease [Stellaceae bacterium]
MAEQVKTSALDAAKAQIQAVPLPRQAAGGRAIGLAVIILIGLGLPFALQNFYIFQLTMAMVYAIALLGLNMLVGYNGQVSLGHGAIYAIGAYVAAILMNSFDWPYWASVFPAGFVCLAFGYFFGLPALRLQGHYLALASLALAVTTPQVLKHKALEDYTGGFSGIVLSKPNVPFGLPINQDQWLYLFVYAIMLVLILVAYNLLRGRIGRAMIAIRDQPIAAEAMGINSAIIKTSTFGVSAFYTGVAGALSAIVVQFVSPDSYDFFLSITLLVGIAVGGFATISGAIYGALFILLVPNFAGELSKSAPWAIYGVLLILVMYFLPTGFAGLVRKTGTLLGRVLSR